MWLWLTAPVWRLKEDYTALQFPFSRSPLCVCACVCVRVRACVCGPSCGALLESCFGRELLFEKPGPHGERVPPGADGGLRLAAGQAW